MILIFVMQEYDKQLREISTLMEQLADNSQELDKNAIRVVKNLEESARKYSLPIQPQLALIRGNLLCGYHEDKKLQLNRKENNIEKKRFVVEQLSKAVFCVEDYFQTARKQFQECEQVCGQIIMHAYNRGLRQQGKELFSIVAEDAELSAALANVISLIGSLNTRIIFEQAERYMNQ